MIKARPAVWGWKGMCTSRWIGREMLWGKNWVCGLNYTLDDRQHVWGRLSFLPCPFAIVLLLVHFIPQMASALLWWPAGSSDFNSKAAVLSRGSRDALETRCWGWYHPEILSFPHQHTDLHQRNQFFSQQLPNLIKLFRDMGSPKYFSVPQGTRMPSGLLKKGNLGLLQSTGS